MYEAQRRREGKQAVSLRACNHLHCRQVGVYHLRHGVCSSLKEKGLFNCFIYKRVTSNLHVKRAKLLMAADQQVFARL